MKRCSACRQMLPLDRFSPNGKTRLNSRCKGCRVIDMRNRAMANPERVREIARKTYYKHQAQNLVIAAAYRKANPERMARLKREWAARNPLAWKRNINREKARARSKRWAAKNPFNGVLQAMRRRARIAGAAGTATKNQILARIAFYGWRCWLCGDPYREVDHVKPIARGGSLWPANLRPICRTCNARKGARIIHSAADL